MWYVFRILGWTRHRLTTLCSYWSVLDLFSYLPSTIEREGQQIGITKPKIPATCLKHSFGMLEVSLPGKAAETSFLVLLTARTPDCISAPQGRDFLPIEQANILLRKDSWRESSNIEHSVYLVESIMALSPSLILWDVQLCEIPFAFEMIHSAVARIEFLDNESGKGENPWVLSQYLCHPSLQKSMEILQFESSGIQTTCKMQE